MRNRPNSLPVYCSDKQFFPRRGTPFSAGLDLCAALGFRLDVTGQTIMVSTGLRVALPKHAFGLVVLRSSAALMGLTLNGSGIIDPDYRGEIMLPLRLAGGVADVAQGERIAQLLVLPFLPVVPCQVESMEDLGTTARGVNGFGSTGKANRTLTSAQAP